MEKKQFNFIKYKWVWYLLSTILLLPGIIAMIYSTVTYPNHTPLKVGIDYTGGTVLNYTIDKEISNKELSVIRTNLVKNGIDNPSIQIMKMNNTQNQDTEIKSILSIKTKFIDEKNTEEQEKVSSAIQAQYPNTELVQVSSVGPTLGKELLTNSLIALSLAFLAIVIYISFRFQFDFAITTILALLHDTLFVLGVFSILGLYNNVQIDSLFITAVLTVIGYSVNDTIVVFDRIRENLRYYSRKLSFSEIVNVSLNQTFARSINTSLTTLLTLLALFFFGGVTTKDFVLAMILGIGIGTYSSIFIASMLLDTWRSRKKVKHS